MNAQRALFEPGAGNTPQLPLRPYQEEAIKAVHAAWGKGVNRLVIIIPMGGGKTVIFSHMAARCRNRTLVLAHREELIDQAAGKIRAVAPHMNVGVDMAGRRADPECHAVVASVQTLASEKRIRRWERNAFAQVVVDECFPAGTLVGGRPIESLKAGDIVPSWSEEHGRVEMRPVVRVMRKRPSAMVRVTLGEGSFCCTPEHPLLTSSGWVPARNLRGSTLVRANGESGGRDDLCGMRDTGNADNTEQSVLLQEEWPRVLLGHLPGHLGTAGPFTADVGNKPQVRVRTYAAEEPDAFGAGAGTDGRDTSRDRSRAASSWREWRPGPGAATRARGSLRMADGRSGGAEGWRAAMALQAGHRASGDEGVRRGRRWITLPEGAARRRSQTGPAPSRDRVAGVQVLEPGGDGTYGGVCPDGLVYNLEVDTTHTYLIDDGFVAHNCHHAAARTYVGIMDYFGCYAEGGTNTLGVTATLMRGDGVGLGSVWQEVVYTKSILEMIAEGYLVNPTGISVPIGIDLGKAEVSHGDYTAGSLGELLEESGFESAVAKVWAEYAEGRPGIVFTPTVATAQAAAQALRDAGFRAEAVWGEMDKDARRNAVEKAREGGLDVLCNCSVLTEGTDIPRLAVALMARPTRSRTLFQQMAGRVLRPHPGKDGALVIDVVGVTADNKLCTLLDLAEGRMPERKEKDRAEEGETLTEAVERVTRVKIGAAKHVDLFGSSAAVWLQTKAGFWFVPAGKGHVALLPGPGGQYSITLFPPGAGRPLYGPPVPDITLAMAIGEEKAREADRASGNRYSTASRDAAWRARKPTGKQLELAARMRVDVQPGMRQGEVGDLITAKIASRRIDPWLTRNRGAA